MVAPADNRNKVDREFMDSVKAAAIVDSLPLVNWALYLVALFLLTTLTWAAFARVDIVSKAPGRVVPDGREQVIASLEGGILKTLDVREGMSVASGQVLAQLDPTRVAAMQDEGQSRHLALLATEARLEAEVNNTEPVFPDAIRHVPGLIQNETRQFKARKRLLTDATVGLEKKLESLRGELGIARTMVDDGLLSRVEMLRVEREVADLQNHKQERLNQFQEQALEQLGQVRRELARLNGQLVMRNDALERTQLRAPVRGFVKKIHVGTIGGIVAPGTPIMEIVPVSDAIVIEARIKPGDIGFVREGQPATVKLTAYEFPIYGGLTGRVDYISPDALGQANGQSGATDTYYLARVHVAHNTLRGPDGPLPVRPGMTGTVEIETGDRTVLSFLLRPVLKSREAFREQ